MCEDDPTHFFTSYLRSDFKRPLFELPFQHFIGKYCRSFVFVDVNESRHHLSDERSLTVLARCENCNQSRLGNTTNPEVNCSNTTLDEWHFHRLDIGHANEIAFICRQTR